MDTKLTKRTAIRMRAEDYANANAVAHVNNFLSLYISIATLRNYKKELTRFFLYCATKQLDPLAATHADLITYFEFVQDPQPANVWVGPRCIKKSKNWRPFQGPLKGAAFGFCVACLSSFYRYLFNVGAIARVPVVRSRVVMCSQDALKSSIENRIATKPMLDAVRTYLNMPGNNYTPFELARIRFVLAVALHLGLRLSEIAKGQMGNFTKKRGRWFYTLVGKGNKYSEIPVPDAMCEALVVFRLYLGLYAYPEPGDTTPLAPKPCLQKAIQERQLHNIIKELFTNAATYAEPDAKAAMPAVSAHWLRHSYVSEQVRMGVPLTQASENARHSDIRTTMLYVHSDQDERHEAVAGLRFA